MEAKAVLKRLLILLIAGIFIFPQSYLATPSGDQIRDSEIPSESEVRNIQSEDKVVLSEVDERGILLKVRKGKTFDAEMYGVEVLETSNQLRQKQIYLVKVPVTYDYHQILEELRENPNIAYAEPDYVVESSFTPSDSQYQKQWYLEQIEMPKAWDINRGSEDVTIAVLDTGVNANHPDLSGRVLPGYDFVNEDADPSDDNGHGTSVSGVIASKANNTGITGIDLYATILPVKVAGEDGTGSLSDAIDGIYYAIDQGVDVINMSYGNGQYNEIEEEALWEAYNKGIVLVASAGNDALDAVMYPAAHRPVISVAATDGHDRLAFFSNYGTSLDLSAPGINIYSTDFQGSYSLESGTSLSAPIVSAVAALLKSEHPEWSPAEIEWALTSSADSIEDNEWNPNTGYGRINAYEALEVELPPMEKDASNEINDAHPLTLNQALSDKMDMPMDVDWYSFEVPQSSEVTITVTDDSGFLDLTGVIYQNDGNDPIQINEEAFGGTEVRSIDLEPGLYFLEVYENYSRWSQAAYRVEVSAEKPLDVDQLDDVNQKVLAPKANLESGTYSSPIDVQLSSSADTKIRYTLDGSTPSISNGLDYSGPINIEQNTTLKAIAIVNDVPSGVVTYAYTILEKPAMFSDIAGHWAESGIISLLEKGIISGYPDGRFGPDAFIKRSEAAKMIATNLGLTLENSGFQDVANDHWAREYIGAVESAGIMSGYNKTTFKPNLLLTREEMAKILVEAYELNGSADLSFSDVKTGSWSYAYIEKLVANDITVGYPNGTFAPKNHITRGEFSVMVARVLAEI